MVVPPCPRKTVGGWQPWRPAGRRLFAGLAGRGGHHPELFAAASRAAKKELDPQGALNPGVRIDP